MFFADDRTKTVYFLGLKMMMFKYLFYCCALAMTKALMLRRLTTISTTATANVNMQKGCFRKSTVEYYKDKALKFAGVFSVDNVVWRIALALMEKDKEEEIKKVIIEKDEEFKKKLILMEKDKELSVQLLYLNYVTVIQPCTGYLAPDVRPFKIFIPFE